MTKPGGAVYAIAVAVIVLLEACLPAVASVNDDFLLREFNFHGFPCAVSECDFSGAIDGAFRVMEGVSIKGSHVILGDMGHSVETVLILACLLRRQYHTDDQNPFFALLCHEREAVRAFADASKPMDACFKIPCFFPVLQIF